MPTQQDYDTWLQVFGQGAPSGPNQLDDFAFRAAIINRLRSNPGQYAGNQELYDYYNQYVAEGALPGAEVSVNRSLGVQDSTRRQARAAGVQVAGNSDYFDDGNGSCGCVGTATEYEPKGTTQLYPATKIPKIFKFSHAAVKGMHCVYAYMEGGNVKVADFTRKQSANAFCRAMNEGLSHLGSAQTFDIDKMTACFNSIIDGGSGAWGLENGFDPPMHGV